MNENLPVHVETSLAEIGSITYANEVVAIIAGMAAAEIDGVATMGTASSIADILNRNRKPVTRGVKVEVGSEEASADITLTVEYGKPIQKVCRDVQESVRRSIETMTGLHVVKVDVHVLGVSFEKETQQLAESFQYAHMAQEGGHPSAPSQPVTARPVVKPPAAATVPLDVDLPEQDVAETPEPEPVDELDAALDAELEAEPEDAPEPSPIQDPREDPQENPDIEAEDAEILPTGPDGGEWDDPLPDLADDGVV